MDHVLQDERFKHIATDPRYRRIPKYQRKVKIDKRFQGMFKDKRFAVTYTVDKRGRPVNQTATENLRKYYALSSDEEESEDEEPSKGKEELPVDKVQKKKEKAVKSESKTQESEQILQDEDVQSEDEDSSDNNCFSSNGELLRVKSKKDSHSEEEEESTDDDDDDQDDNEQSFLKDQEENKKQLKIRRKNENTVITDEVKSKLQDLSINYARGEGVLISDSSSDDESSEYDDEEEIEHNWGELDKEAETTDEVTHRLAVCNMDWDRIRALDLMVLFNSFLPSGGLIKSVTIYPSEFGLKRMKEEELRGPVELTESNNPKDDDREYDDEEGSEYHMEKLRQYQLNRLKYYYAVVDFDSAATANKVYTECDGIEYESTATKLDLRFIPDDMEFDHEPRETCTETPEFSKYQPRQFTTTALQQVKVELTWDETNPERQEFTQKVNSGKLDDVSQNDLQAYLATDSSDSEPETKDKEEKSSQDDNSGAETVSDPIEKYKSLLKEIEEQEEAKKNKEVELEFTWGLGAEEKAEKLVKERLKKDENLTPFEQYLEKRKAKKKAKREERKKLRNAENDEEYESEVSDDSEAEADTDEGARKSSGKSRVREKKSNKKGYSQTQDEDQRKAELELLLMDENGEENKRHFNMKRIEETATMSKSKQKRLSKKKSTKEQLQEDDFAVNVEDPRFNALFTSHHFNIDPADPHYRKTKGTEALVKEKLKRRADTNDAIEVPQPKQKKTDKKLNVELQALIKSVKRNAQNISQPIKR